MPTIDVSKLAVTKLIDSSTSGLRTDASLNNGNVYIGDLRDPKSGLAFNAVKYYGSKIEFTVDGTYIVARTDGDPYPAKTGADKGYLYSTPTNEITLRSWYDDPNPLTEQSKVYTFTYRGGTNTESASVLFSSGGVNGIFNNGVAYLSPMGGQSLVNTAANISMTKKTGFYINAFYFMNFLGKDTTTGHPEQSGQYHYHTGAFLYNGWNNTTFYESNSYYKDSYYTLPSDTPSPYYNKAIFSDLDNSNNDHMRHADGHSKLLGFCFDGYPIYGPFGYTNSSDATGGVKLMTSSYVLSNSAVSGRPYGYSDSASLTYFISTVSKFLGQAHSYYNDSSDASRNKLIMGAGAYVNDYTFTSGVGTLDYYNGKYTKTPDYPDGTYAYFLTLDSTCIPQYPYIVGNYSKQQRTFSSNNSVYCAITSNKTTLATTETATLTFTTNQSTTNFVLSDVTVSGGTLSSFSGSGKSYIATFTPSGTASTGSIYVGSNTFTDSSGNNDYGSNTVTLTITGTTGTTCLLYTSDAADE